MLGIGVGTWIAVAAGLVWLLLLFSKRQPETSSMREFIGLVNSRGGIILVLTTMSVYFFREALGLFYHALGLLREGKLTEQNAILLMALQFVTGTAFGGSFGALLTTMTGHDSQARASDKRPPAPSAPVVSVPPGEGASPLSLTPRAAPSGAAPSPSSTTESEKAPGT